MAAVLAGLSLSAAGEPATLRLKLEVPADLPPVWADPERLERVLLNLLHNAYKFSPADGTVTVRARQGQGEVEIAVIDAGRGIDPADQPHIFDRFYRPAGQRRSDSVGLGLYITRMLVEAHGGSIRVESTPGKGASFIFTLPCLRT